MLTILSLIACLTTASDTGTAACVEPDDCDGDDWIAQYDCDDNDPDTGASRPTAYYPDLDGDGVGAYPGQGFCSDPGEGWVTVGGDCDDTDPTVTGWPC